MLIEKAEQLDEVKAYREKYKNPTVFSHRTYGLDLRYQMLQCEVTGEPCVKVNEINPHASMVISFNEVLTVKGIVLWCVDGLGNAHFDKITSDIVEHLKTKECV